MTISYAGSFGSLLLKWKGSLWKAVWLDLLVFLILYYILHFTYIFALNPEQKEIFRLMREFCKESTGYIPLTFLLGFFVVSMVDRWWDQYSHISWPQKLMLQVTTLIAGDRYRLHRRTLARWTNLTAAIAWRKISIRTMKRFPTEDHLVAAGLMTFKEKELYDKTDGNHGKWWLPLIWINNLLKRLTDEGVIDTVQLNALMQIVELYRCGFTALYKYDWVCIPLVYTQVVTIATYGFFFICLFGRQFVDEDEVNSHAPIFTVLQFLFYMGWLKVGQALMNPFGEDDDDFEMNHILDGNIYNAYKIADHVHGQCPDLERDMHWDTEKISIPYTRASMKKKETIPKSHLNKLHLSEDEMALVADIEVDNMRKEDKEKLRTFVRKIRSSKRDKHINLNENANEELHAELTTETL